MAFTINLCVQISRGVPNDKSLSKRGVPNDKSLSKRGVPNAKSLSKRAVPNGRSRPKRVVPNGRLLPKKVVPFGRLEGWRVMGLRRWFCCWCRLRIRELRRLAFLRVLLGYSLRVRVRRIWLCCSVRLVWRIVLLFVILAFLRCI